MLQEVSNLGADVGLAPEELKQALKTLFEGEEIGFDISKIDDKLVTEGWNSKVSFHVVGVGSSETEDFS